MTTTKSQMLFMAKIAENAERYEDMKFFITSFINESTQITIEQLKIFKTAYKNIIRQKQVEHRTLLSIISKSSNNININLLNCYFQKISKELINIYQQTIDFINDQLIKKVNYQGEIICLQIKADYYRFMHQAVTQQRKQDCKNKSRQAYLIGTAKAQAALKTTHPIRLSMALNFSIFLYEIEKDKQNALKVSKQSFHKSVCDFEQIPDQYYNESSMKMLLMRDYFTLWQKNEMQYQQ